jgi:hypothetical protein
MNGLLLAAMTVICAAVSSAQITVPTEFRRDPEGGRVTTPGSARMQTSDLPPSNSVSHIAVGELATLWIGTGKGLASSADAGVTWEYFRDDPAFAVDGIFSISIQGSVIWTSMGYERDLDEGSVQTGGGYAYSVDGGATWTGPLPQTLDGRGDSILQYGINDSIWILPVVVPEQNVTFDLALDDGIVWIASWASGLRRSPDFGITWERILLPPDSRSSIAPTDTLWTYAANDTLQLDRIYMRFDPRANNNMLAFAALAYGDTVWCGTAGGVNRSTDGGLSWSRFTHSNQSFPILGDWVIAIERQQFGSVDRIWTTNWQADQRDEEFGVSYSDDLGLSWTNIMHGVRAYDFWFRDSVVYIATNQGIYRTADAGASFTISTSIADAATRQVVATTSMLTAGAIGDTVFVGTSDGLARTIDNASSPFGSDWQVMRTYQKVGASGTTYAYPNPFSPLTEPVRIHYAIPAGGAPRSVKIELFDFGMNRVRTLIHGERGPGMEHDELWYGDDDDGNVVANGVYFYRIDSGGDEPLFGKIIVLQ